MRPLAWLAAALTLVLIPFGALVRLEGAGLSCPDWPLCYGAVLPPPGYQIALETGHRAVAVLLGLVMTLALLLAWRPSQPPWVRRWMLMAYGVLLLQGLLGGLTVLLRLWLPVVLLHLLLGLVLLSCLLQLANGPVGADPPQPPGQLSLALLGLLLLMVFSGNLNSTLFAGYSCNSYPGCNRPLPHRDLMAAPPEGQHYACCFLPQTKAQWVHMSHRLVVGLGGLLLLLVAWGWIKQGWRLWGSGLLLLLALQILVGALNSLWVIPLPLSVLHSFLAALLYGWVNLALLRQCQPQRVLL